MNKALRNTALVGFVMFALLFGSTSYVQFVSARSLNDNPLNNRTLINSLSRERGPILVNGEPIAQSSPVDSALKFQRNYGTDSVPPDLYSAVTGYFSIVSGTSGIERTENGVLSGDDDSLFYDQLISQITGHDPIGAAVELTLNPEAQKAALAGLGDQRGAVAAMNPQTGEVLALVSTPGFDPNQLATHDREAANAAYQQLLNDPANPLQNRAIAGNLYPPGSTFKIVTAAAALESGKYTKDSELPGPATISLPQTTATISNASKRACGPNDKVTLKQSLVISCNTSFAHLGMELGVDAMNEQAEKFGFSRSLEIPLGVTASSFPKDANAPQLAQSAIGQYEVKATPLQMAMVSAAVANKGVIMQPELISQIRNSRTFDLVSDPQPTEFSRAMSEDSANQLKEMMVAEVNDGNGRTAAISGVDVGGKTGTAQHASNQPPHAWFTAFAPAEDPQIAIAVVVERGGNAGNEASGARVAGPIAKDVMEAVVSK